MSNKKVKNLRLATKKIHHEATLSERRAAEIMEQINIISKKIENQKLQISNDLRHMDEDLKIMKVIAELQQKSNEYTAYYDNEKSKVAREMEKIKFLNRKIDAEKKLITVEEEAKDLQKNNDMGIYKK